MSILRGHPHNNHPGQSSEVTSSLEAEQYLGAIIAASPQTTSLRPEAGWNLRGSTTSVNSLAEGGLGSITTPTLSRRNNNPFSKAMDGFSTLTRSSGRCFYFLVKCCIEMFKTSLEWKWLTVTIFLKWLGSYSKRYLKTNWMKYWGNRLDWGDVSRR